MLGYRKKSFMRAHELLDVLRTNPEKLVALKDLQLLLLDEIILAEEKIRKLKSDLKNAKESHASSKRISYLERRIDGVRRCAYIWRCFGDAIAFLYMDKHALKHTHFNTENVKAKSTSGFIGSKEGLRYELNLLLQALERNVPALLTDLTNTIRHGDVCLMGASDPYLIEAKASKKLDTRGKRQVRDIKKLHAFYEADVSDQLRGLPMVRRQSSDIPEREYSKGLNDCIAVAFENGYATHHPEPGVHYLVFSGDTQHEMGEILAPLELSKPWFMFLNEEKSNQSWAPYTPFTLLIKDGNHLWSFIKGELVIVIVLDMSIICKIAKNAGLEAELNPDNEDYPVRLMWSQEGGELRIAAQLIARAAMECVSLEWIVLSSIERFNRMRLSAGS